MEYLKVVCRFTIIISISIYYLYIYIICTIIFKKKNPNEKAHSFI